MAKKKNETVDTSRRLFFSKSAKAAAGVAAAGVAATGITKAASAASNSMNEMKAAKAGYALDDRDQAKKMSKLQMEVMSDDEKDQMLAEILSHHDKIGRV